jgi:hypothetical protein
VFKWVWPRAGRGEHDAVRPRLGCRKRAAPLRRPHQINHPRLDVPAEALPRPPAEDQEAPPDDRVVDGRAPRVSGDAERDQEMQASMGGQPIGLVRAKFEPLEGGEFLIQHADAVPTGIEVPPERAASSPFPLTTIIGLDLASETFYYPYADARGVYRVYQMSHR